MNHPKEYQIIITNCVEARYLNLIPKTSESIETNDFRGITLVSVVCKVFRTIEWLQHINILNEGQSGFSPGRSAINHIFSFSDIVRG